MKRILCLILSVILICLSSVVAFAEESEKYITVPVEYSDHIGSPEQLEVMVKDNNVYVNAEMLTNRLGYQFGNNEECITIYNTKNDDLPFGFTQFFLDSTKVSHMIYFQMVDTYEAPFPSLQNEKGYWIPLEYSLIMLNSGLLILDNTLSIDMPQKDIIDYYFDIQKNGNIYRFDWNKDFGYTETDWKIIGASSHIINMFNGILDFDGDSWAAMFQAFIMDSSAYDKKYGENLALLLCTESDEELKASIKKIEMYQDIFSEKGQLGENILKAYSKELDLEVGELYAECEKILEEVKAGNSSAVTYNKSYQALENAFDKQTWFSEMGGNIIQVQKRLSDVTSILNIGLKIAEVVSYGNEFANQDEFSLAALDNYLNTSSTSTALPEAMKQSIQNYSDMLSSNLAEYSARRFFDENVGEWITEGLSLNKALGTQANVALFTWNIASNTIPFISDGLDAADKFELALYSQVFQADTFLNYQGLCNSVFNDIDNLDPEKLYNVAQYCYIYLKTCYTTRNAAIASLAGKSDTVKEQIQPLIDYQNGINSNIAQAMVMLKAANKTNEGNVYGFLPSDNKKYLNEFDNDDLNTVLGLIEMEKLSDENEKIITINSNDTANFTGILKSENYEINSNNKGTVAILELDIPFKCYLYDEWMSNNGWNNYNGKTEFNIDSIQVSLSNAQNYYGKNITVTGTVTLAHTGHHRRDIVLLDSQIKNVESTSLSPTVKSTKTDLSNYIGSDILDFVKTVDDMYDVGATDGSTEYSNGNITVSAGYGSNSIIFVSINGDCNYSIRGIEYGMSFEDATNLAYEFCDYIADDLPYYKRFVMADGASLSFHAEDEKTVDSINFSTN